MNCKPGELAVIVCTGPNTKRALGRLVVTVKLFPASYLNNKKHGPGWTYEGKRILDDTGMEVTYIQDICLRPIRDNDQQDQTITWAGKPERLPA